MLQLIKLFFLLFCLRASFFIYKLLLFDVSEIKEFLEKNNEKQFILCSYGHTSWKDSLFSIISAIKIGNIKGLVKYKYKPFYPKCIHKYIHFI